MKRYGGNLQKVLFLFCLSGLFSLVEARTSIMPENLDSDHSGSKVTSISTTDRSQKTFDSILSDLKDHSSSTKAKKDSSLDCNERMGLPVSVLLADAGDFLKNKSEELTQDRKVATVDGRSLKSSENHVLELPLFFSSHMVLQRDIPMKFWGWGSAGDTVKATLKRQGRAFSASTIVAANGRWSMQLPSQSVCKDPCTLNFELLSRAGTLQTFDDILIGDVWFAGGQSNMEKKVSHLLEAEQYISEAKDYPLIRSFRASYYAKNQPQEKVNSSSGTWFVCDSLQVGSKVSAVAYVYARELSRQLDIPIGIIQSYRGGTEIETWMSPSIIQSDPELSVVAGRKVKMDSTDMVAYPSIHFNGQINPLAGFPIRGFIFYQGESNTKRALEYRLMMKKLIQDWRNLWGLGNIPFYYVQMFNMGVSVNQSYEEGNWQDIREQQALLLSAEKIPNIGMAVTIDTNEDPNNPDNLIRIHPKNKKPVGERLARIALKQTYCVDLVAESPSLNRYWFSKDTAYLVFRNQGNTLKVKDGDTSLKGFVLAGEDKSFKSADAQLVNDSTIALRSSLVPAPVAVRYGWAKNPVCNLYNSAGLPASPFRTDIWPSGYVYQKFASTSAPSSDASLVQILVNGSKIPGFQPENLSYSVEFKDVMPQITAISSSPFAKISIEQPSEKNNGKATLLVTAEDNSIRRYEVFLSKMTDIHQMQLGSIHIRQQDKSLFFDADRNIQGPLLVFDPFGKCLLNEDFNSENKNGYLFAESGVYLGILYSPYGDYKFKFVIE